MNPRPWLAPALAWLLYGAGISPALHAQTSTDGAPRPSAPLIQTNPTSYNAQQRRIQALNESGRHRVASYSLAKAQCWLDVSFHEFSRNDRSMFPQRALNESFKITDYLARGGDVASPDNPAAQTPGVLEATRLRPDLWAQAEHIKRQPGYRCAENLVACSEVALAHADHEFRQQQWRHAQPYVQMAEDRLDQAQAALRACTPAPSPPATAVFSAPAGERPAAAPSP